MGRNKVYTNEVISEEMKNAVDGETLERLVNFSIGKYCKNIPIDYEDKLSIGYEGACYAMRTFDASKGQSLNSYIVNCATFAIEKQFVVNTRNNLTENEFKNIGTVEEYCNRFSEFKKNPCDSTSDKESKEIKEILVEKIFSFTKSFSKVDKFVFDYYFIKNKTLKKISDELGVSSQSVSKRIKKIKISIAKKFQIDFDCIYNNQK